MTMPVKLPAAKTGYGTIVAAVPWAYGRVGTEDQWTLDELKRMRPEIEAVACPDSMLFVFAPHSFTRESYILVNSWGYRPVTQYVWWRLGMRPRDGWSPYGRVTHELIIAGVRGSPQVEAGTESVIDAQVPEKGKARDVYAAIGRVSPGPYLALWGDNIPYFECFSPVKGKGDDNSGYV